MMRMNHETNDSGAVSALHSDLAQLRAQVAALELWRAHQSDLLDGILNRSGDASMQDVGEVAPDDDEDAENGGEWPEGWTGESDPAVCSFAVADVDRDVINTLIEWVHRHVCGVIARPLRGEIKWCPLWWEHPEAIFRFTALHRAWRELASEPGAGLSIYIRDHLDPCLRELTSPVGPFADCGYNERHRISNALTGHQPLPTLPIADPHDASERQHPGTG